MDSEKHRRYTGVPNQIILDNLRWLDAHGKHVIIRIPVIPGVNDDRQNLEDLIEFLGSLQQRPEVHLLGYHQIALQKYQRLEQTYTLGDVQPPSPEEMEKLRILFENNGFRVTVGG
jgi:pyruvate formate lyase activating enzyme